MCHGGHVPGELFREHYTPTRKDRWEGEEERGEEQHLVKFESHLTCAPAIPTPGHLLK